MNGVILPYLTTSASICVDVNRAQGKPNKLLPDLPKGGWRGVQHELRLNSQRQYWQEAPGLLALTHNPVEIPATVQVYVLTFPIRIHHLGADNHYGKTIRDYPSVCIQVCISWPLVPWWLNGCRFIAVINHKAFLFPWCSSMDPVLRVHQRLVINIYSSIWIHNAVRLARSSESGVRRRPAIYPCSSPWFHLLWSLIAECNHVIKPFLNQQ